jgi:hypothetical protein
MTIPKCSSKNILPLRKRPQWALLAPTSDVFGVNGIWCVQNKVSFRGIFTVNEGLIEGQKMFLVEHFEIR